MANCQFCFEPLSDPQVKLTFAGFTGAAALNGVSFDIHARCLRAAPDRGIALPDRIEEPELVSVDWEDVGWTAECKVHGNVGVMDNRDDAHLAAARHIARVHAMVA